MAAIDELYVQRIHDRDSLIGFLRDRLGWPAPPRLGVEEMFYDYSADDLQLDPRAAERIRVRQLAPFSSGQPWGVFLLETAQPKLYATYLRRVLRGLAPTARQQRSQLPAWPASNLLFIATHDYRQFTFAHFEGERAASARLRLFGWERDRPGLRTLCEHNLPALAWPPDEADHDKWLADWSAAFDVQAVTERFFRQFRDAFEELKAGLPKAISRPAERHAFSQRLLNRLLFLCFLQKKRWLRAPNLPHPTTSYLFDLYDNALAERERFYRDYLWDLFFNALSRPPDRGRDPRRDAVARRLGTVPFLNGGLFDPADDLDARDAVDLPNRLLEPILARDGLLRRYNFTVTESTPLNQEVAVDPEMLGKIFETVVLTSEEAEDYQAPNLRKATGSYYTPRIVVNFIVREVLKDYLVARIPGLEKAQLTRLMEIDAAAGLPAEAREELRTIISQRQAAAIRQHLDLLRACDPAVGSGAFALGLLHELVNLNILCDTVERGKDPRLQDPNLAFTLKKRIIEQSIYGVDLQAKAVEICKLRLWLSLIVDYEASADLATCDEEYFDRAIAQVPALPNLGFKIRRGDSLLDLVRGRAFRLKEVTHRPDMQDEQAALAEVHRQFFGTHDPHTKRRLRLDALVRRARLTRLQLESQREELQQQAPQLNLFDRHASKAEVQRYEEARAELEAALGEVAEIERALRPLCEKPTLELADDALMARLEAAGEDDKITFSWELDFPEVFSPPAGATATLRGAMTDIVNQVPGQMELPVRDTSRRGGFDIIVGNPPFVTARNPSKRELYRKRWEQTCHLKFQLVAPFFERSFGLLQRGGHLGFIVSNAFTKREFGRPLVQRFLPTTELTEIVDCSGLMFPGHGTPTCIVFARRRRSAADSPIRVVATLPGGGDLRTPPEDSALWAGLQAHHEEVGYADARIAVSNRARAEMAIWPWSLDVSTAPTRAKLEATGTVLEGLLEGDIGVCTMTNADDIFVLSDDFARRLRVPRSACPPYHQGEEIRDWSAATAERMLVPYTRAAHLMREAELDRATLSYLRPFRSMLEGRHSFGSKTFKELGRRWYEFERMNASKYRSPEFLAFPMIATHLHFVYISSPCIFGRHAQVLKLPDGTGMPAYLALAAVLNSSSALFWLKQVCFSKRESGRPEADTYYEFSGGKVQLLPLAMTSRVGSPIGDRLSILAQACAQHGAEIAGLGATKLFEAPREAYHPWNSSLEGWAPGHASLPIQGFHNATDLIAIREAARDRCRALRCAMVCMQEDMDWLVYAAYDLLPANSVAVALQTEACQVEPVGLGERPFELLRDGKPIPERFTAERRTVWEARLQVIRENEHIRRIEQPAYKRRWYRKESEEEEFRRAFEWWLLEKAEWWLEKKAGGGPLDVETWAAALWQDARVQAAVQVVEPAAANPGGFERLLKGLVVENAVPDWIPPAMDWEQVERKLKKKVPGRAKRIRGKLNVPRERFRVTEDGRYVWAGLDVFGRLRGKG